MSVKLKMVLAMVAAAASIGTVIYLISGSLRWAITIGGMLLLTDLILVPKILPHIFKHNNKSDDDE